MSHFLDRPSFFTRAKAKFADGHGVMTTEDRSCARQRDVTSLRQAIHQISINRSHSTFCVSALIWINCTTHTR